MNVLVPTDFSLESHQATRYVLDFLKDHISEHRVYLVHAYRVPKSNVENIVQENDRIREAAEKSMLEEKEMAVKYNQNPNVVIDAYIHMGLLKNVIYRVMVDMNADMVVMGKDGGTHIHEMTHYLKARNSSAPLLTVFNHKAS